MMGTSVTPRQALLMALIECSERHGVRLSHGEVDERGSPFRVVFTGKNGPVVAQEVPLVESGTSRITAEDETALAMAEAMWKEATSVQKHRVFVRGIGLVQAVPVPWAHNTGVTIPQF